jgi:hypothetical protein
MKVGKKSESFYILDLPNGTYNKNLAIWIFFLQNLANLGLFP